MQNIFKSANSGPRLARKRRDYVIKTGVYHNVKSGLRLVIVLSVLLFTSCSYDPEFDSLSDFPGNKQKLAYDEVNFVQPAIDEQTISQASDLIATELENDSSAEPVKITPGVIAFPFEDSRALDGGFVLVSPAKSNVVVESTLGFDNDTVSLIDSPFASRGISCGDFDDDRLVDLLVVDHDKNSGVRLFKNLGDLEFEDVTSIAGLKLENAHVVSSTVVDINNDGLLDIYLCIYNAPNKLFINRGRKFVERSASYGLDFEGASVAAAFSDFDRDGDLDLYLVTNRLESNAKIARVPVDREPGKPPRVKEEFREIRRLIPFHDGGYVPISSGQYDYLFRNDDSRFNDVTEICLGEKQPYRGMAASWCDFNNDGWPDLYVTNDKQDPDQYFRNLGPDTNGDIKFEDVLESTSNQISWFAKGVDIGDVNRDGYFDLLVGGNSKWDPFERRINRGNLFGKKNDAWFLSLAQPSRVFGNLLGLNRQGAAFLNISNQAGVANTDCTWSIRVFDFDNDGRLDLHCSNGAVREFLNNDIGQKLERAIAAKSIESIGEFWLDKPRLESRNFAFRQMEDGSFANSSNLLAENEPDLTQSTVVCDFDQDGDLDIACTGMNAVVSIFRNDCAKQNSLVVKLKGEQSNAAGIDAIVELVATNGTRQKLHGSTNRGFLTSEQNLFHFGLGDGEVEKLEIRWPTGAVQTITDLPVNHFVVVTEPARKSLVGRGLKMELDKKYFISEPETFGDLTIEEIPFDDFARQPLIPTQHSTMGPGMAWSDIDNDGDYDMFIGGSAFEAGRIYENVGKSRFVKMDQSALSSDSQREDLGAVFFDVDNDGDEDLFVTSGGVEDSRSGAYIDRVYLNDGSGGFTKPDEPLLPQIPISSMSVAAADFDNDKNIDLFVGGRIVPGQYPSTPRSVLYRNVGGKLEDVTDEIAPELRECGLVTSCLWSDINDDRLSDLVVCCEWGPVRVFKNLNGSRFQDVTSEYGLASYSGIFQSICGGDVDNDGDIDFVVGNYGTNTAYVASNENPIRIRYGPFGGEQSNRLLESFVVDQKEFPMQCLSGMVGRYAFNVDVPTSREFAMTTLGKLFGKEQLERSDTKQVDELRSGVFINQSKNGRIQFVFQPLPDILQSSPIRGMQLVDVNCDGNLDLYCLQNETAVHPLLEKPNSGFSQLLLGNGNGGFNEPESSTGLFVKGVGRSLAAVDLNEDARCDLVSAEVDSKISTFINQSSNAPFAIDLRKISEGKNYIGAKVRITFGDGTKQLHEIRCGSGYISQSPPIVYSGSNIRGGIDSMTIEWPDGTRKTGSVKSLSNN